MRLKILLSLYFAFMYSSQCYAFDWEKCRDVGTGQAGAFTSSLHFTSSWGPCSIFANNEDGKKLLAKQVPV